MTKINILIQVDQEEQKIIEHFCSDSGISPTEYFLKLHKDYQHGLFVQSIRQEERNNISNNVTTITETDATITNNDMDLDKKEKRKKSICK